MPIADVMKFAGHPAPVVGIAAAKTATRVVLGVVRTVLARRSHQLAKSVPMDVVENAMAWSLVKRTVPAPLRHPLAARVPMAAGGPVQARNVSAIAPVRQIRQ